MKTMSCKQLGGACDNKFHAQTFDEMVEMSKKHGRQMAEKGDTEHLKVMEKIKEGMNDPQATKEWVEKKQRDFDALLEDK